VGGNNILYNSAANRSEWVCQSAVSLLTFGVRITFLTPADIRRDLKLPSR